MNELLDDLKTANGLFVTNTTLAGQDLFYNANNDVNGITYWKKLQSLKSILLEDYLSEAIFEDTYFLENGKEISRIYVPLHQKVSIHNKNTWQMVMEFFAEKMRLFEAFFTEYEDFLKQ